MYAVIPLRNYEKPFVRAYKPAAAGIAQNNIPVFRISLSTLEV